MADVAGVHDDEAARRACALAPSSLSRGCGRSASRRAQFGITRMPVRAGALLLEPLLASSRRSRRRGRRAAGTSRRGCRSTLTSTGFSSRLQLDRDLGEDVLADHDRAARRSRRATIRRRGRRRSAGRSCRGRRRAVGRARRRAERGHEIGQVVEAAPRRAASGRTRSSRRGRSRRRSAPLARELGTPAQPARDDGDVEVVGERLAELRQQVRRRLDARPVVLVEDEQARSAVGTAARLTSAVSEPPLRILFAVPAYWPAGAFGGPVWVRAR